MSMTIATDPVLVRFREALDRMNGSRIECVVLFGSRARGDARPDSDYDVAIFLKDFHDRWSEVERLVPLVTDILYDDRAFIHAMPYREGTYRECTPLMHEIHNEGLDL
jgi:predicted nucleotidyltransferase